MDAVKQIDFTLNGKVGGEKITPKTIGLHLFNRFNHEVEEFIAGSEHGQAKEVRVSVEDGSYKLVAFIPMLLANVVESDLQHLDRQDSLRDIDPKRASVIRKWQAQGKNIEDFSVRISSVDAAHPPVVVSRSSDFHTPDQNEWVQVEEYVVGTLVDMGGAAEVNIHLRLPDKRTIVVSTSEQYLRDQPKNYLYRKVQARILSEKNVKTGAYRNQQLLSIIGEAPSYDETELRTAIAKGTAAWADVPDAVAWVREQRGGGRE